MASPPLAAVRQCPGLAKSGHTTHTWDLRSCPDVEIWFLPNKLLGGSGAGLGAAALLPGEHGESDLVGFSLSFMLGSSFLALHRQPLRWVCLVSNGRWGLEGGAGVSFCLHRAWGPGHAL